MASGTGLFDQDRQVWDEELLNVLPVSVGQLSPSRTSPPEV
jgi:glycerol kinase